MYELAPKKAVKQEDEIQYRSPKQKCALFSYRLGIYTWVELEGPKWTQLSVHIIRRPDCMAALP